MNTKTFLLCVFFALMVFLTACVPGTGTPTDDRRDGAHTEAAETVIAGMTLSAGGTAVAKLTELARPTLTDFPFLQTRLPTSTLPLPTRTPEPPTLTPSITPAPTDTPKPSPCDWAALINDDTNASRPVLPPGAKYRKVWRLVNIGRCTWTTGYRLIFASGELVGDDLVISMPEVVQPGYTVDLAVRLNAPFTTGNYSSEWFLQNSSGEIFGVGTNGSDPLRAEARVAQASTGRLYPLDMALDFCTAFWDSSDGGLACLNESESQRLTSGASSLVASGIGQGFVALLAEPALETRHENEPALWVRPADGKDAWIRGEYPPFYVSRGNHFVTEFGCLERSRGCRVNLRVDYRLQNGTIRNLGVWNEAYDDRTTLIDIDLSGLAGRWVEFILTVTNSSNSGPPNAFLFVPRVKREAPASEILLTWRREVGTICEEVQIYLLGDLTGEALAFQCSEGRDDPMGTINLTGETMDRLLNWRAKLRPFEGVFFPEDADRIFLSFKGQGTAEATAADIQAMDDLANQLFSLMLR